MKNLKTCAALVVIALAAVAAGCGNDGEAAATAAASAPYDITLGEWVVDLEDEKTEILKAYVADTPSCDAEFDDRRFLLTIAAVSTDYEPSTPLPDVVEKYC